MAQYFLKNRVSFIKLTNPPVNGLSLAVREGIMRGLDQARQDKGDGLVLFGEKNFSAGADIAEFASGKHRVSPGLNEVLCALDNFDKPLLACINGVALGGGLETALSCQWRLCSPKTVVGLPEVHLGILPGAGGTQRLPRLIGVEKALEIMLSGRNVTAAEALKLGIVDSVSDAPFESEEHLVDCAYNFILTDRVQSAGVANRRISSFSVSGSPTSADLDAMEKKTKKTARGFAAPINIAKAVRASVELPFEEGLKREGELFSELASGTQAPALQYQFFSERSVSNPPAVEDKSKIPAVWSVGVIGGGTMGAGIAMCFANAGLPVTLVEKTEDLARAAINRIEGTYKSSSAYKNGAMSDDAVAKLLRLITPSGDMNALRSSDIVIEAVFENMEVKKDIFRKLESICKSDAILATNTSYLSVDEIAAMTTRPASVIGTHFFSPANVMKLLEVVRGEHTSPEVIAACMLLGKKIKKMPVLAGNCFGFIGNRMLEYYGREAVFLVEEGALPSQVDAVLKNRIGMAMGFFEMSDLAGNDVGWRLRQGFNLVGENATGRHPQERYCSLPDELCEKQWFGQKTQKGWYVYDPSAPRKALECQDTLDIIHSYRKAKGVQTREVPDDEILERCMYSLVNEGFRILEEGIAASAADIDVVYVYGYGFPKFRGGPMWWAEKEVGLENVLAALIKHSAAYPQQPWLIPSKLLVDTVNSKSTIKDALATHRKKL